MKRSGRPSTALVVGTVAGVPVGQMIVQAAQEFGVQMGPASASLLGTLLSLAFAYWAPGGRKGDAR